MSGLVTAAEESDAGGCKVSSGRGAAIVRSGVAHSVGVGEMQQCSYRAFPWIFYPGVCFYNSRITNSWCLWSLHYEPVGYHWDLLVTSPGLVVLVQHGDSDISERLHAQQPWHYRIAPSNEDRGRQPRFLAPTTCMSSYQSCSPPSIHGPLSLLGLGPSVSKYH